jgi:hypothetical protein
VLEAVRRTKGAIRFGPALQTIDRQTLRNVKRSNISEHTLIEMARAAAELGQRSYTELILGLPGDTVASHLDSIRVVMDAGLLRIKMYPLVLLPGTELAGARARREFGLQTRFRVHPQCHGTYRFNGSLFPSVEVSELVIATRTMSFADYLSCKSFELSVEIFYNDFYLEELHGLMRGLGLSMFEFVQRCHARLAEFPEDLKALYTVLEQGICDNLWESRDACLAHFRDPAHLEDYVRQEYKTSLATLKAIALLEQIEAVLAIAHHALWDCVAGSGLGAPLIAEYVDDLIEYSRLRRQSILDTSLQPEGTFRFAFDRIMTRAFCVDPTPFRLPHPMRVRFWHDETQAHNIRALCAKAPSPVQRARSFIYPDTDPGVNPYLRRSRVC